jgi:uncharacterized Zn-binding protein involved in type VI secretion
MPPAARATDLTAHGGIVTGGDPTVLIGGLPAARLVDPHVCPLATEAGTPHVGGVITRASTSVLIGGQWAARMLDSCDCLSAGVAGGGAPSSVGPERSTDGTAFSEDENWLGRRSSSETFDRDNDGTIDGVRAATVGLRQRGQIDTDLGGAQGTVDVSYAEAEAYAHGNRGYRAQADAEAGAARARGRVHLGSGSDPWFSFDGTGRLGRVQAQEGLEGGDSGQEIGSGFETRQSIDAFNIEGTIALDLGFVRLEETIDWGGGLGLEAEGRGEYRREDGRWHTVYGVAARPFPVGVTHETAYGNRNEPPDGDGGGGGGAASAGIPNFVAIGDATVLIG